MARKSRPDKDLKRIAFVLRELNLTTAAGDPNSMQMWPLRNGFR
jgi:hypothetical protein